MKGDIWLDYCQQRWIGTKQNEITIGFNEHVQADPDNQSPDK
jgi:hypothetical protein